MKTHRRQNQMQQRSVLPIRCQITSLTNSPTTPKAAAKRSADLLSNNFPHQYPTTPKAAAKRSADLLSNNFPHQYPTTPKAAAKRSADPLPTNNNNQSKEVIKISAKIKIILISVLIIVLSLLVALLVCVKLAFTDDNTDKYTVTPDITPATTIAVNAALGNETDISEMDLNHIVAYLVQKANDENLFNEKYRILAAYFDINSGAPSRCYFQVDYKERILGFSADIRLENDHTNSAIHMYFENAKVGRLKVPNKVISTVLKRTNLSNTTNYISLDELSLNLPTQFNVKVPVLSTEIPIEIQIEDFKIFEDEIHIETNPIASDALDNAKKDILGKIGDYAAENIPDIADTIGGYLDKFKKDEQ